MVSAALDVGKVRSQFPALSSGYIYADNAGGSQCLKPVIERITDYLTNTNVQLGADYSASVQSTKRVAEGSVEAAKLFNAASPDEIAFGSSTTMLLENLARGLEPDIKEGDEFIVTGEHEGTFMVVSLGLVLTCSICPANGGPWKKLAKRTGAVIKYWELTQDEEGVSPSNPYRVSLKIDNLLPLITNRTRVVAFTACSNILGSIVPVKEVVKAVRETAASRGAGKVEISVDCVAYAPHRQIDVRDWDVDYCVFSFYKVKRDLLTI
jgi:selenocysteine lyase/cysteine desulfurase